jgi:hypothetical protein
MQEKRREKEKCIYDKLERFEPVRNLTLNLRLDCSCNAEPIVLVYCVCVSAMPGPPPLSLSLSLSLSLLLHGHRKGEWDRISKDRGTGPRFPPPSVVSGSTAAKARPDTRFNGQTTENQLESNRQSEGLDGPVIIISDQKDDGVFFFSAKAIAPPLVSAHDKSFPPSTRTASSSIYNRSSIY